MFPSLWDYAIFSPFKDLNLHKNETILTSKGINGLWKKVIGLQWSAFVLARLSMKWPKMKQKESELEEVFYLQCR